MDALATQAEVTDFKMDTNTEAMTPEQEIRDPVQHLDPCSTAPVTPDQALESMDGAKRGARGAQDKASEGSTGRQNKWLPDSSKGEKSWQRGNGARAINSARAAGTTGDRALEVVLSRTRQFRNSKN